MVAALGTSSSVAAPEDKRLLKELAIIDFGEDRQLVKKPRL